MQVVEIESDDRKYRLSDEGNVYSMIGFKINQESRR